MGTDSQRDDLLNLRARAEQEIRSRTHRLHEIAPPDLEALVNELEAHQVELEIQNEELRRTRLELEESRRRYADLFEFAPVGYFLLDNRGLIHASNLAGARMANREKHQILKKPFSALLVREDIRPFLAHLHAVFRQEVRQQGEFRMHSGSNGIMHLYVQSVPANDSEHIYCNTAIVDISERKRVEEALQESEARLRRFNEELEARVQERTELVRVLERQRAVLEQLAAMGRIAARAAHEINNPLAGIKNAFELLKDGISPDFKYASYVPRVQAEIDRIARIVQQMFLLARPPEDEGPYATAARIIEDVAAIQELSCQKLGITLEYEICSGCDRFVRGNPMRQILFNLTQNAIDVTPRGGTVRVRAGVNGNDDLEVAVSDEGPGIPEDRQAFLFEPFYSTKDAHKASGLGLGLSISKSLAEGMDGTLSYSTVVDKGSTFTLSIPPERRGD